MTILDEIIAKNRQALEAKKAAVPERKLRAAIENTTPCRDFYRALSADSLNVIAELKKASPSKGIIRESFDVITLSSELEKNGAAALSVLTEEFYFKGSLDYLKTVKQNVAIPVLRKDFIFDPYQIYEARAAGADAILLIAAALDGKTLSELYGLARGIGLHVLSEIHNHEELEIVMEAGADIIGINCRDLKTFKTDLKITEELLSAIPDDKVKVAESGIRSHEDLIRLRSKGASAFLIGETVMREADPGRELQKLLQGNR